MTVRARLIFAVLAFAACVSLGHAQEWAKARLEKSPRHQEWVDIKYGNRTVHAFVVYPEVKS
jgi:carboxymethylenebutenolidase